MGSRRRYRTDQLHCGPTDRCHGTDSIDTIQEAGKRVEPAEIESILVGHPTIVDGIRQVVRGTRS